MPNLNDLFVARPLDFARRYAIDAGQARGLDLELAGRAMKSKATPGGPLFQVKGEKRIYGCEIVFCDENAVAQDALHRPIGRVKVTLKAAGSAGSLPIYWLPWVKGGLARTTLRPRQAKHNPTEDPDYFFTAGVNGCMVFVEGQRDQPTVYHANAMDVSGPADPSNSPRALFAAGSDGLATACIQAKVDNMTQRFRQMSQARPKLARDEANPAAPRPALPLKAGALSQKDYLVYKEGPPDDEKTALIAALGAQSTTGRNDEISIEEGQGTVFGIRDDAGSWTFYYQKTIKIARIRFTRRSQWARQVGGKEKWKAHVLPMEWIATEVKQFWPNAAGSARFEINRT